MKLKNKLKTKLKTKLKIKLKTKNIEDAALKMLKMKLR